jgi:peptidoglycan biosynthesis protein MviN/MurJ (putative lipid II flippase)
MLPRLSRMKHAGALLHFRDEFTRGAALVGFVAIPSAVAYLVLASPIAHGAAFGEMATPRGIELLAASLAALAIGVLGEGAFMYAIHASYALADTRAPLHAMVVRTAVSAAGMAVALALPPGIGVLIALGLAIALGDLAGAAHLILSVRAKLPRGGEHLVAALCRSGIVSVAMVGPAYLVAVGIPKLVEGSGGALLGVAMAGLAGIATFAGLQHAWGSPELSFFLGALPERRPSALRRGRPAAADQREGQQREADVRSAAHGEVRVEGHQDHQGGDRGEARDCCDADGVRPPARDGERGAQGQDDEGKERDEQR